MGRHMTKKKRARRNRTLRFGALALLCLMGVGLLAGMALFNRGVKPNRDMQWYVREGAVEVAAPAMAEGYDGDAGQDSEFLLPEEGMRQAAEAPDEPDGPADDAAVSEPDAQAAPGDDAFAADDAGDAIDEDAIPADDIADDDIAADDIADDDIADVDDADAADAEPEPIVPNGEVTIKITAAGDCTFEGEEGSKSNRRFLEYVQKYGYDYFLSSVRDIFEEDDLTIVNLEGPLTNETKRHSHGFVFKADPKCVDILTGSSVEVCNVANNHSTDYGVNGLKETAKVLDEAGIGYCGYTAAYETTIKGVRICCLGFTKWNHSDEQIVQAVTAMRPNCDLLIVNMHWGREHVHNQNAQQVTTGHAIIDAGADLVIGTHPHVIQGIELYKGKYIVYSLGNFCFAGNANPEDKRCIIFQQTFSFTPGMGIVQAGLLDAGINIIPASITSANQLNNFQPVVLEADQGAQVLQFLAGYCNFKFKEVRWMPDNYLLANGLIQGKNAQADGEAAADAEGADEGGTEAIEADDAVPAPEEAAEDERADEDESADDDAFFGAEEDDLAADAVFGAEEDDLAADAVFGAEEGETADEDDVFGADA